MNNEEEWVLLRNWFAFCLLEAVETLPKVLSNPKQAQRDMNRLRRHSEHQLTRQLELAEGSA